MTKEQYEKLRENKHFEPLWLELLNASGFAGVLPTGGIVDRRYYPEAIPVQKNTLFGVAEPKEIKRIPYEDEINEFLKEIFYEDWMDDNDWAVCLESWLTESGKSIQSLSNDLQVGMKNGYSIESQFSLIKSMLINKKKQ